MKIGLTGAAGGEVTGSAYFVETRHARVLVLGLTERRWLHAQIHTLSGFSAHAGQKDLLSWLGGVVPSKPAVVLTHGEDGPRKTLAGEARKRFGVKTSMPRMGEVIEF